MAAIMRIDDFAAALDILAADLYEGSFAAEPDARRNILASFEVCQGNQGEVIQDLKHSKGGALGGEMLAAIAAAAFEIAK